jgi:phytoene synthase
VKRLSLYDQVAHETAAVVIRRYSTSFGLASRLLGAEVRGHVENIYALVRVAD